MVEGGKGACSEAPSCSGGALTTTGAPTSLSFPPELSKGGGEGTSETVHSIERGRGTVGVGVSVTVGGSGSEEGGGGGGVSMTAGGSGSEEGGRIGSRGSGREGGGRSAGGLMEVEEECGSLCPPPPPSPFKRAICVSNTSLSAAQV